MALKDEIERLEKRYSQQLVNAQKELEDYYKRLPYENDPPDLRHLTGWVERRVVKKHAEARIYRKFDTLTHFADTADNEAATYEQIDQDLVYGNGKFSYGHFSNLYQLELQALKSPIVQNKPDNLKQKSISMHTQNARWWGLCANIVNTGKNLRLPQLNPPAV